MRTLFNVTTADGYIDANTIAQEETERVNFQVANAGIAYQLGTQRYGVPVWGPESVLLPGKFSFDRNTNGVRIRSLVAGAPAQVTVDALTPTDLGPSNA
jgi:hypothetical protein